MVTLPVFLDVDIFSISTRRYKITFLRDLLKHAGCSTHASFFQVVSFTATVFLHSWCFLPTDEFPAWLRPNDSNLMVQNTFIC